MCVFLALWDTVILSLDWVSISPFEFCINVVLVATIVLINYCYKYNYGNLQQLIAVLSISSFH